jgi:hypothetical protein
MPKFLSQTIGPYFTAGSADSLGSLDFSSGSADLVITVLLVLQHLLAYCTLSSEF